MKKITIFVLLLCGPTSSANADQNRISETRFHDGSIILSEMVTSSIDVITKYGKLTIPVSEIVGINFGFRYPDKSKEAIESLIQKLNANDFKERDNAQSKLKEFGYLAMPLLKKASKSGVLEVEGRSKLIIESINETERRDLLSLSDVDEITTTEFTFTGTIVQSHIKTKSSNFGDFSASVSSLRSVTFKQSSKLTVFTSWVDTGINVDSKHHRLSVSASGQVDLWPQQPGSYMASPKGKDGTNGKNSSFLAGSLIGKIGENGNHFYIGDKLDSSVSTGRLYLKIVESPWGETVGSYSVFADLEFRK